MATARKIYPFVAALFVFLAASPPIQAQDDGGGGEGLTCGWCRAGAFFVGAPSLERGHHFLFDGGGECLWEGHDSPGVVCSRCGGDQSSCHSDIQDPGYCHILCGPAGDAVVAMAEIRAGLASNDMAVVASALVRDRIGVSVEFVPGAGRIDVILPCDRNRAFATIPVLPGTRHLLEAELKGSMSVAATLESLP